MEETDQASASQSPAASRRLIGLLVRRPRWGLDARAKAFLLLMMVIASLSIVHGLYRFLAMNKEIQTTCLVIEGWVPLHGLQWAHTQWQNGTYKTIITLGGPFKEGSLDPRANYAEYCASRLRALGVDEAAVHAISSVAARKDRTYAAAAALRGWLDAQRERISSLNVLSVGPHARRSRLLFRKALGRHVSVGVIALETLEYDPAHWWRTSEGVRDVLGEGIAYLYAWLLFRPDTVAAKST